MMAAVGSIRFVGILLPGKGSLTVMPLTTRVVLGSKTSLRQIELLTGSTVGGTVAQFVVSAALKSPLRCAAVGTTPIVLVMNADWRNCSKLKKKNVLS